MALLTKTQIVCDVCGSPRRQVRSYRLARDEEPLREYVLCQEHAKGLEEVIEKNVGAEVSAPPRSKVYTMKEIEEMKKGTAE